MDDEVDPVLLEGVARAMWEADLRWLQPTVTAMQLEERWCRLWTATFRYERESLERRTLAAIAVVRAFEVPLRPESPDSSRRSSTCDGQVPGTVSVQLSPPAGLRRALVRNA